MPNVKAKAGDKITALTVVDKNGSFVRCYTQDLHGAGFKQLADKFATKIKGKTRKVVGTEEEDEATRPAREVAAKAAKAKKEEEGKVTPSGIILDQPH
jgi:hypothetical protein